MTFSQGSAAYILLKYDCGGISLGSTACGVWRHLFDLADVPGSVVAELEIWKLNSTQMMSFTCEVQAHLNHLRGDISEQSAGLQAFALLCRVHEDFVKLRARSSAFSLPEWTLQKLELELGRRLGHDARGILQGAYPVGQEPRPFCLRDGLQITTDRTAAQPRGELCYHSLVAVPLMQLVWQVLKKNPLLRLKVLMDSGSISVPGLFKPNILICHHSANLMCAVVKGPDVDIGEAWQEAIGYSMLLSPHANFCTMVMAVVGNRVRMGLLTLLDTDKTATVGADSAPRLPQNLPPELKSVMELVRIEPYKDNNCTDNLKILYGIQFEANVVNTDQFDGYMIDYLHYVLQATTPYKSSHSDTTDSLNDYIQLFQNVPQKLTFTEGSSSLICKVTDTANANRFTRIHELLKYTLHRYGSCPFTSTDEFKVGRYFTCVMNYIPGHRFDYSDEGFADVCAIVTYIHDELNICHGDLRRPNVIEKKHNSGVRIIDWEYGSMIYNVSPIHHGLQTVRAFNIWVEKFPDVLKYTDGLTFLHWCLIDIYAVFYFIRWDLPPPDDTQGSGSTTRKRSRQNVSNRLLTVQQMDSFEQVFVDVLENKYLKFTNELNSTQGDEGDGKGSRIFKTEIAKAFFSTSAILSEILASVPGFSRASKLLSDRWPLGGYTYDTTNGLRPKA